MAAPADSSLLADLEHPWLGLESFREETRDYFFGRDTEVAEIHLRLRSHPLLLLYGRSGLGKTSILSAGLIPRLCAEGQRPVLYRLNYKTFGPFEELFSVLFVGRKSVKRRHTPVSKASKYGPAWKQKVERISRWRQTDMLATLARPLSEEKNASELGVPFSFPQDAASRLWLRLHYRKEPPDITHLILDQFEEVFTLGADRAGTQDEIRDALAIILQGAVPEPISRLIAEHDVLLDHFDPDSMPVRVILALRDDYVYALNRWKRHLPALGQNNFELRALRGSAAFDAVFKPGELRCKYRGAISEQNKVDTGLPPIVNKETAERIVRFVAKKDEEVPLEEIEAVPPILSLLCRELNERRFTEPGGTPERPARQIIFSESDADVETIIKTFYERCLAGQPEAVRIFIEEELVSNSGARLAQDEKSILSCFEEGWAIPGAPDGRRAAGFGDAARSRECLKELVNQRLLTPLGGGDNLSYELIHDLLAAVAEKSRTAREERVEKEQANQRADAEKRARDAAEATRARAEAEKLIQFMMFDLRDKLEPIGRLSLLDDINRRVQAYYDSFAGEFETPEMLRRRGVALQNQGEVLLARGDLAAALKSYCDSLAIAEWLAEQDPGNAGWQRDLSLIYLRVGDVQRDQGDLAGASKSYGDSLAIAEKLATQDPGNAGWQRDLSLIYLRVGDVQRDQGDLAGASKSYGDSLAIAEKLATQDPGNAGWQSDLSASYVRIGDVQSAMGKLTEALNSYHRSLAITKGLAGEDPSNAGLLRDLSVICGRIGDVQNAMGNLAEALNSYCRGLAITEGLSKQDPSNAGWQRDLSVNFRRIGDVQSAMGNLAEALKSYYGSLAITEKLATQDPGNAGWQRDLSLIYLRVGDVQRDQGDLAGASQSYGDSLAIAEKLATQDPGNAGWQRDLSLIYLRVGDVQRDQGDLAGASQSYGDSLAIAEKLATQDPGNAGWQSDLSASYVRIGDVQSAMGKLTEALNSYHRSLAITKGLAGEDPSNAGLLRDLSVICGRIGDVQNAMGNLAEALKSYYGGLAIAEGLSKQDPSNAGWQRDLSVSYDRVGDVQRAQGDLAGALKSYRDSLAIAEKLSTQDPGNAGWQAGLGWTYWQTGALLEEVQPGSKEEGMAMVQKGHDILRQLKEQTGLTVEQQKWLDESETDLTRMRAANR